MILTWFALGIGIGLVIWFTQRHTVKVLPEKNIGAAKRLVIFGAVLRWILGALLLALALMQGIQCGVAAFAGLMISRWVGILSLRVMPISSNQEIQRS